MILGGCHDGRHPPSDASRPAVLLRDYIRFWHDREFKPSLGPAPSISSQNGLGDEENGVKIRLRHYGVHELPVQDELSNPDELL